MEMYKEQDEVSYSTFLPIYNTGTSIEAHTSNYTALV